MRMQTLLLATDTWDLITDADGNIALAGDPYAVAQDVASACRTWKGELWYNTAPGIPYKEILGQSPPLGLVKAMLEAESLTVPGVASASCLFSSTRNRTLSGQIQVTTQSGEVINVGV